MSVNKDSLKKQLLSNADVIVSEIFKGNDIELRLAANGGIKVLVVNKKLIKIETEQ
jgi:hypothetical protein